VQQERAQELQGADDLPHEPDANKSSDHADREIRHTEQFRDQQELLAVRAALKRIAEGVFGECVDCQKTIALPRLQATPAAMRCIACQTKFESKR